MERSFYQLPILAGIIAAAFCLTEPASSEETTPPSILSHNDSRLAKEAFTAVSLSQWETALAKASAIKNPLPQRLVEWLFLTNMQTVPEFSRLERFVLSHQDWPDHILLEKKLETLIPDNFTARSIKRLFHDHSPKTTIGATRFGAALISLGEEKRGVDMLRKWWRRGNFTKGEERNFFGKYRMVLDENDHEARLKRLLWEGKTHAARRMLSRVSPELRQLGIARIYLIERHPDVDKSIAALPKEFLTDAGLIFDRALWRRRAGKDERARQLLFSLPEDLVHPDKWWREIKYHIRISLNEGFVTDAYQLAANSESFEKVARADASWLAGWIALQFLNEPDIALNHFEVMHQIVSMPISRARAAYWAARAADKKGDKHLARHWFQLGASHPTTFYGQLSGLALGYDHLNFPMEPKYSKSAIEAFEGRDIVQITRILGELGEKKLMRQFALHLARTASTPAEHALIGRLTSEYDFAHISIAAAKRSVRSGVILIDSGYPNPFSSFRLDFKNYAPELALILAVSRQESEMDPNAVSSAGARGLLQLMPRTAKHVARRLGLHYDKNLLLNDPEYNLRLGTAYLAEMLQTYKGCYVLALAAYNAGPRRVKKWLRQYGDPRSEEINSVDWIERIPYNETRNYIQRILETTEVYRERLGRTDNTPTVGTWQVPLGASFEAPKC